MANDFVIYASNPPLAPRDVLVAPATGPGAVQGMSMAAHGAATVTENLGAKTQMVARPTGVATVTARLNYTVQIGSASAGVSHVTVYLGSPARVSSTCAGAGHMTAYLSSPQAISSTSNGVGRLTAYLGSPAHVTSTSAGVGHVTAYLSSPQPLSASCAGVGHVTAYLSTPVPMTATSNGVAHVTAYLSSPQHMSLTSAGVATSTVYLSSPVYFSMTARGQASFTARVAATYLMQASPHGVGHMAAYQIGPVYSEAVSNGVGNMSIRSAQQLAAVSRGSASVTIEVESIARGLFSTSAAVGHMSIEVEGVPALYFTVHGVSTAQATQADHKPLAWSTRFNSLGTSGGAASVTIPPPRVGDEIDANGVGHMTGTMTGVRNLVWTTGIANSGYPFYTRGGVGRMELHGPTQMLLASHGQAFMVPHLNAIFANNWTANGIATVLMNARQGKGLSALSGGVGSMSLLQLVIVLGAGDLLALHYSRPIPLVGQLWPRRIVLPGGVPV